MDNADLISVFNTIFLRRVLELLQVPNLKLHVGSVDSWPESLVKNESAAMIFNTQYRNEQGQHWIAVYIDGTSQEGYMFDSMPTSPFPQIIRAKICKIVNRLHNTNPDNIILQDPHFPLCGVYCLYFLERMSKGLKLELCVNNTLQNDVTVLTYMWRYMRILFNQ